MRNALPSPALVSCCVLLALLVGCSGYRTQPVKGKVTIKNAASPAKLAGYGVMLEMMEPGPDGKVISSSGVIDAEGKFQLGTHGSNDGAYPGKYRVAITPSSEFAEGPKPKSAIDPKYHSLQTSGLEAVIDAKTSELNWELDPGR
ncbi:hypothetical protein NA78x_002197 [Anatilimnocola sp. NA78]|uniref:hypothetical protein n=1 Tax=Anatilimnocola sp. NA78 TaxID=3415683 RepID=UPI003CE51BA3